MSTHNNRFVVVRVFIFIFAEESGMDLSFQPEVSFLHSEGWVSWERKKI